MLFVPDGRSIWFGIANLILVRQEGWSRSCSEPPPGSSKQGAIRSNRAANQKDEPRKVSQSRNSFTCATGLGKACTPMQTLPFLRRALLSLLFALAPVAARAGSATWKPNPQSSDWNQAGNWTPATVPNGDADVATFGASNVTAVDRLEDIQVAGIVFSPGASAYTIGGFEEYFGVGDLGVVNNSGLTQNFVLSEPTWGSLGTLYFYGAANAGSDTVYTIWGAYSGAGGFVYFYDSSSAGNATLIANGETNGNSGGTITFEDNSTAGDSTLITNAVDNFYNRGEVYFLEDSRAGNATLIINGGILNFMGKIARRHLPRRA